MTNIYARCHMVGGMTSDYWARDPKRLAFVLARYKFVARMFEGKGRVLEVGCADGFGSRIVRQHVEALTAIDVDAESIAEALQAEAGRMPPYWPIEFRAHDILAAPLRGFDAVYALDVLEHMDPLTQEQTFLEHLRAAAPVAVIGSPSLESQVYASELSRAGHVNCRTAESLRDTLRRHWAHVFMFGMNDEVLHCGFGPMCQYRIALCIG